MDRPKPPKCASGGIGRLAGFRCQCSQGRAGSTPASRTSSETPLLARIPACRRGFLAGRGVSSLSGRTPAAGLRPEKAGDMDIVLIRTRKKPPTVFFSTRFPSDTDSPHICFYLFIQFFFRGARRISAGNSISFDPHTGEVNQPRVNSPPPSAATNLRRTCTAILSSPSPRISYSPGNGPPRPLSFDNGLGGLLYVFTYRFHGRPPSPVPQCGRLTYDLLCESRKHFQYIA